MNDYAIGIEGMPKLLLGIDQPLKNFKRNLYADTFKRYYTSHAATLEAIENGYNSVVDKEQFLMNMAFALADAAEADLAKLPKKAQQEKRLVDFNLCMAVYVIPAIQEYRGASTEPLTKQVLSAWKQKFPKTNVQASTFANIDAGFKRKFCYITTAVCETFGKSDDCYELTLLRKYRDTYLAEQEHGSELIREYYDLAPTIVKHINQNKNRSEIYEYIWRRYLNPCISMIEANENEECRELYSRMVRELQKEYFKN